MSYSSATKTKKICRKSCIVFLNKFSKKIRKNDFIFTMISIYLNKEKNN